MSKENYEKIKSMCRKTNIAEGKITDEYIFTLNAIDYFFFNRNLGEMHIVEGFTDGKNDGGIDFILNKDDTMFLIQGKSSSKMSIEEIKDVFYKIFETINDFEKNNYDKYSRDLKRIYLNRYDDLSDDKNIEIVLFTNTVMSDDMIKEFEKFKNSDIASNYRIILYDCEDIEKKEIMSLQEDEFVASDFLNLFEANNKLTYKDGIIVNITATSLKKLYAKHSQKGLFSFNLREHISQKNVDNGIEDTIKNDPSNFWFYNNGITIGCGDYNIDGNRLSLYEFSIINGAQTTTKIGTSKIIDADNDFPIVCKVVKANGSLQNSNDFISKISEASNSQKPIRARDLKANSVEQKRLQLSSANNKYPLAIEIKRGVKPLNEKKVNNKWQKVTNEYIGQLILSCSFQRPGTARSGKASIFSSDKVYNMIYKRNHDYNTLYDYVRIANIFDIEFKPKYFLEESDAERIGIMQNGKFTILAIIFYIYKRFYCGVKGYNDENLYNDNIYGSLTLSYSKDDYDEKIFYLFKYIIRKLTDLYKIKRIDLNLTSYSNFFKTDKTYVDVILKDVDEWLSDEFDLEKINKCMSIFEEEC